MGRERTGHLPSYAEAKKLKLLALHTHGCSRASVGNCSSSASVFGPKAYLGGLHVQARPEINPLLS